MHKSKLLVLFILIASYTYSQTDLLFAPQVIPKNNFQITLYPTAKIGSHINEAGYAINIDWLNKLSSKSHLVIGVESLARYNQFYLGIPDNSLSWINRLRFTLATGLDHPSFNVHPFYNNLRRHNLDFSWVFYASTDGTSQLSGGLEYTYVFDRKLIQIGIENDIFGFMQHDSYRTSALYLDVLWAVNNKLVGIGLENILWTGNTNGLFLPKGEIFDMTGRHGGEYTHGILAARLHYQNLMLKVGYDSDGIRKSFQDTIHNWFNEGLIPRGTESRDRVYIQLTLNAADWIY
ncbi:MAG: polymorphic toxin type 23 domain-containing protein [Bacteroidota bacterium]